jgi:NitT/TauT family transport system ATP-binding protein
VTHNLHEALRLADRILVLSPAPGRLAADRIVDLPRPRDEYSVAFLDLLMDLRSVLGKMPARI